MKPLIACAGILAMGLAVAADLPPALKQLRADLEKARSLPVGTKTAYRCPGHLESAVGLKLTDITAALPEPDMTERRLAVYVLASPPRPMQRGGGAPQIEFIAGESDVVERVRCTYAR